jgi:hypothetical protein
MDRDAVVRLYLADAGGAARAGMETNRRVRTGYREANEETLRDAGSREGDARASRDQRVAGVVAAQSTAAVKRPGGRR